MKYRKRPVVVEARQVPDEPDGEFELWLGDAFESWLPSRQAIAFHVKKNGNREAVAHAGDWIIAEPDGDGFYPSVSTVTGDLTLPTKEKAMSVWEDMARDAGTHIDAGISLAEAAAMHEAEYAAQHEQAMQEQAQQDQAERQEWVCTCPGDTPRGDRIFDHDRDCALWREPF